MGGEKAVDVLYCADSDSFELFSNAFIYTQNSHGTGCTLSSAIASYLAKGDSMREAVREGKKYISGILEASRSLHIGKGRQGVMNHMYREYYYE